ncbi:MarR family winged helix-turn-helix transcriptional regulator [Corynebacterium sp. YSMAA5_1_F9]|uniref:MarR family winged helix-turn-helix transcriptional regulator n=1 Tax=unclassified Corynebacterium TaxID=2624378 RepID=UPI0038D1F2D2
MTADIRWLNEEEQDLWRHLLASIRKINRGMEETLLACGEISISEYSVLVSLSEAPNKTLRLRELCSELDWDRSRASHQITRMEKRGLVRKERCSGDARGVEVVLTDTGMERLEASVPEHVESVRRMVFDHLDPADAPALKRFCQGVLEENNLPGYSGFVPDERLGGKNS